MLLQRFNFLLIRNEIFIQLLTRSKRVIKHLLRHFDIRLIIKVFIPRDIMRIIEYPRGMINPMEEHPPLDIPSWHLPPSTTPRLTSKDLRFQVDYDAPGKYPDSVPEAPEFEQVGYLVEPAPVEDLVKKGVVAMSDVVGLEFPVHGHCVDVLLSEPVVDVKGVVRLGVENVEFLAGSELPLEVGFVVGDLVGGGPRGGGEAWDDEHGFLLVQHQGLVLVDLVP